MRYTSIAILLACLLGTTTANAGWLSGSVASNTPQSRHAYQRAIVAIGDPRPGAWCGWFLRHKLGVADRAFNLAREWFHWGHPHLGPCVGCVAVSYRHVGLVTGQDAQGHWLVEQGNPYRNGPDSLRWVTAYRSP